MPLQLILSLALAYSNPNVKFYKNGLKNKIKCFLTSLKIVKTLQNEYIFNLTHLKTKKQVITIAFLILFNAAKGWYNITNTCKPFYFFIFNF